jgi:hypothetical protein
VQASAYSFGDYLGLYHRQKRTYLRTSLSMLRPTIATQCTQHSRYRWIRSSRCIILPRSTRSRYFTCYTFTTTSRYRCGCFTTPGRTRTERRAGLILWSRQMQDETFRTIDERYSSDCAACFVFAGYTRRKEVAVNVFIRARMVSKEACLKREASERWQSHLATSDIRIVKVLNRRL